MLVTTKLLSPQNYVCHDKHIFVTTIFVTTTHICHKYLLQQTEFCRNKSFVVSFVVTKHIFCYDKSRLVMTKL